MLYNYGTYEYVLQYVSIPCHGVVGCRLSFGSFVFSFVVHMHAPQAGSMLASMLLIAAIQLHEDLKYSSVGIPVLE